ncbi:hypothetical protein R1flu_002079 [Riccia fluitans]|uniref:26S proteasome complex subunit SEM1 n=1 Tax=Riccia fluitans TaxID=41844 RepID=A0ABD1Y8Z5_9MARC
MGRLLKDWPDNSQLGSAGLSSSHAIPSQICKGSNVFSQTSREKHRVVCLPAPADGYYIVRIGSKLQEICAKFLHYRQEMAGAPENAPKQASEDVKLDLFEDDDEFEEFETEEWDDEEGEKVTLQQWEEDWDDDDVNDDFSAQLRTELESASAAAETPAAAN